MARPPVISMSPGFPRWLPQNDPQREPPKFGGIVCGDWPRGMSLVGSSNCPSTCPTRTQATGWKVKGFGVGSRCR